VTNDAALRRCLEATLGALNAMTDATRHTPLRVWDTTTLGADCSSFTAPA
jgi:hypothetical protein